MRNLDFAMRIVSEGVADMEDRGFKVVPANAREAVAYVFGATEAVGSPDKIINSTAKVKQITKRVEEILSKGRMKRNPRSSREDPLDSMYVEYLRPMKDEEPFMMDGTKYEFVRARYPDGRTDIGVYSTAGDVTYGYRHWRKMMNLDRTNPVRPRRGESERDFVSRCMSEEKMKFPKQKQRIAVCLSKARRNPFPDRNLDE